MLLLTIGLQLVINRKELQLLRFPFFAVSLSFPSFDLQLQTIRIEPGIQDTGTASKR